MTEATNSIFTQPRDDVYSVFQKEAAPIGETNSHNPAQDTPKLGSLGFFGRMLEGTAIVAFSLFMAIVTMTTGARAETGSMLSSATGDYASATMIAMVAMFAIMLAMLRKTWRQTGETIEQAPRRSHRIS